MATGGLKRPWRNSACLILASGAFKYKNRPLIPTSFQVVNPAFTPVCLQDLQTPVTARDKLEFLMVKRSDGSSFMPSNYVFPGGVIDAADYARQWVTLFENCAGTRPFASITPVSTRLPLYSTLPADTTVPGEVAFRICAIREIFEEAGILLARDQADVPSKLGLIGGSFPPAVKKLPSSLMKEWRSKVHTDALEFVNLCKEFSCVPDIWSLVEWSTWLTPRNFHKRFDTVFYLCFSEAKPEVFTDKLEVFDAQWLGAESIEKDGSITVAPPQMAELYRLNRFGAPSSLHSFALYQSLHSLVPVNKPVRAKTKDNILVSVMGEDDLYPLEYSDHSPPENIHHHPRAAAIRDAVNLVTTNHTLYEYKIPTHTAKELHQCSQQTTRFEFGAPIVTIDSVLGKKITEHELRYQQSSQECSSSKL